MSEESKSILTKLKELNKKKSLSIFLPSLGKKSKFLPFTLKQQKTILSSMPTDASGLMNFNNTFNRIITENSEDELELTSLNFFDRISIILNYRYTSMGGVYETENGKVNVNTIIKKIAEYDYKDIFEEKTIALKDISVRVKIPDLKYDSTINDQISKKLTKKVTTQEIVSELYTSEILKYIIEITIDDVTVNLHNTNYYEKLEIIEQLPGSFVKKILAYIQSIKQIESDLVTVDGVVVDVSNELFS